DHLHALQAHHAIGLRPAAVVADAHAEASAEKIPDAETEIARFEIAFLEMLEASVALVLGMTGQVDLAVLGDDSASLVDDDRRVEAVADTRRIGRRQFRIT